MRCEHVFISSACVHFSMMQFCFGGEIRQFHLDSSGVRVSDILLGRFIPGTSTITVEDKHFRQLYSNGEVCDLTGQPRSVVVRYICNEKNPITFLESLQVSVSVCRSLLFVLVLIFHRSLKRARMF